MVSNLLKAKTEILEMITPLMEGKQKLYNDIGVLANKYDIEADYLWSWAMRELLEEYEDEEEES